MISHIQLCCPAPYHWEWFAKTFMQANAGKFSDKKTNIKYYIYFFCGRIFIKREVKMHTINHQLNFHGLDICEN